MKHDIKRFSILECERIFEKLYQLGIQSNQLGVQFISNVVACHFQRNLSFCCGLVSKKKK